MNEKADSIILRLKVERNETEMLELTSEIEISTIVKQPGLSELLKLTAEQLTEIARRISR